VDSTVYLPELAQYDKVNDVYREFFPKAPPARTIAGAKLIARRALVEMMLTAVGR
jgi:enamine deaminase RidA (YjgF/YER057c/UK114 family)